MCDCIHRRGFLRSAATALAGLAVPSLALGAHERRRLRLYHTHTSARLDVVYYARGNYDAGALSELNAFLGDFRSGDQIEMDPNLFDVLFDAQQRLRSTGTYEVISAYRSPATNEMLRKNGRGVAKNSLHMTGTAIDVRLTDVASARLRQAGLELRRGGVGYYPTSDFVHLDTGRVRNW